MKYLSMKAMIISAEEHVRRFGEKIHTGRWQGNDVSERPEAEMVEARYLNLETAMISEDLEFYREAIKPNLPWADDHFLERVSGSPLNPGEQWRKWPWAHSADRHRTQG